MLNELFQYINQQGRDFRGITLELERYRMPGGRCLSGVSCGAGTVLHRALFTSQFYY